MIFVKVCGLTRAEDARRAWDLGASALGFVFHPRSPRNVSLEAARNLRAALPREVLCVGVFVDATRSEIQRTIEQVGLGAIQLHGTERPEACTGWSVPVIKALRPREARDPGLCRAYAQATRALLLDADHPDHLGGTGQLTNWELASRLALDVPLILSGGIHAGNVNEAMDRVRPFGIDLSSGLESAPGIKDPLKLQTFFRILDRKGRPCRSR